MKKLMMSSLVVGAAALSACGAGNQNSSDSQVQGVEAVTHRIQPLGVSTSCLGSVERVIRDHRVNPPRVYSQYVGAMKDCSPPASSLVIQLLGGQQWVGGYAYVTIKKNGLCLTNPITSVNGGDRGEVLWQSCIPQLSSAPDHYRQQWELVFNNNNALRIQTHAAEKLGLPGGQVQCLERDTPSTVKRVACSLNNWQVTRGN